MASNADKEYHLRITGDSRDLGEATKRAATNLNAVKQEALGLASALSGGLIGGGVVGVVTTLVGKVTEMIRDARLLAKESERLDISRNSVRGMRNVESALALEPGTLGSATSSVRQQVQEALAGSPEAIKAINDFGLRLESLSRLSPDQQLSAVLSAAGGMGRMNDSQRASLRTLAGPGAADLEGYVGKFNFKDFAGYSSEAFGALSSFQEMVRGVSAIPSGYRSLSRAMGPAGDSLFQAAQALDERDRAKREQLKEQYEPLAQFGIGSENRATKLEEELRQRVLALSRQQLSVDERITAAQTERDKILQRAASETNVERRRRLQLRATEYESEILQLQGLQPKTSASGATPAAIASDSFTRVGRYFLGAGDPSVNIGRESLQTLRSLKTLLEKLPAETGREVASNL
jgi:hypothetical protein